MGDQTPPTDPPAAAPAPPVAPAAPTPAPPAVTEPPAKPEELGESGKKALEREREARKAAEKAQKDLEARIKEFEDRDKTENQRLADELAVLREQNAKTEREALVARVAMTHKLDADDLELLHGDTEEELTARAKRIQSLKTAATAGTGAGSADQGAKPPANTDLPSQIKAAEDKGDFALAMRLKNQHAVALITKT